MIDWSRWVTKPPAQPMRGNHEKDGSKLFKLLRFYSVASLAAIFIAAVLFILFIRKVAVQDIIELSERNNLTLAQTALNVVKPELLRFLATAENIKPGQRVDVKPPEEFTSVIADVLRGTAVTRIKLYNRLGTVVFSTQHEQIGEDQEENGGFQSAIKGKVESILIYRDTFNSFDRETEDDNLISTYIPIRGSLVEAPLGVFEIYTDATSLVSRNERTEFVILLGVALILGFLYVMLVFIVRRASHVIDLQQHTIQERTTTLEMLSAHLLTIEERDKKKIAFELHEGLAQTLCSLKMELSSLQENIPRRNKASGSMETIIPVLQSAIQNVLDIAQGLRPSSLDTLGLLPTIDAVFRNFAHANPEIRIDQNIALQEGSIPTSLKVVIFRIIESVLEIITSAANTEHIQLGLRLVENKIALEIVDHPRYLARTALIPIDESYLKRHFAKIRQQTILSGGTFFVGGNAAEGIAIRANWPPLINDDL